MKSVLFRAVLVFVLGLWLAGPALATKVNVKWASADYADWQTWAFVDQNEKPSSFDAADRTAVRALVWAAIADRLKKQGFEPATEGQEPDFRVAIDGSLREVFDVQDYHEKISEHVAFVMEGGSTSYQEGTLMIRILEGDAVVWTGWVTEKVDDADDPGKQIRKVVKKILRRFPPREE